MKNSKPKSISRPNNFMLRCEWTDGFEAVIKLSAFRKECPCADCNKDEKKGGGIMSIPVLSTFKEGQNELVSLHQVGNYAVAASWGDGHDTGIYTWENLREIFEKHKLSDEEIKTFMAKTDRK